MNINASLKPAGADTDPDYELVSRALEIITRHYRRQPSLDELAHALGISATQMQKTFTRWSGLSPKGFLQAFTLDRARQLLQQEGLPLPEASYEVGLSGPGRLHDLFVTHEAVTPGIFKAKGEGLTIRYGFHACPFGITLIMATDRGLAGMAFCDPGGEAAALADMCGRWPRAEYVEDPGVTESYAIDAFNPSRWSSGEPLRVVLIGTDFQIRVWEALLDIPLGAAMTYGSIARRLCKPSASRAVGAAVGRNPISFVVPCHRAVGSTGALTGYHWGVTRKRAMLGWETGHLV